MFVAIAVIVSFAPSQDSATLFFPVIGHDNRPLSWALANGAAISGAGPAGSLILHNADAGLGWRAPLSGALAIRVPQSLCTNASTLDG